MITAFVTKQPFDHLKLYSEFLKRETDATGTVVLHHGRVKRPGKQVPEFSTVELKPLIDDVDERLAAIARSAKDTYTLNQVLVVHRLGIIGACDSVLLAIVSGNTRDICFAACSWVVDEVKKEECIQLIEHP
ncbi:MAG: molybdenum cofactor biosynthesis protein MoaE [Candidatus Electrothrix sp. ATG1]|nr:molybdenum cofactor biosynthesis protein MoaE [Candidatus Electrothrix sp. ATG1]